MTKTDDLKLEALFRAMDNETPPEYPIHYPPPAAWAGLKDGFNALKGWKDLKGSDNDFVLYIHFPFCKNICGFCGFHALKLSKKSEINAYFKLLDKEAALYAAAFKNKKFSWLCVGGGTPSLMSSEQIKTFFEILKRHFNFSKKVRTAFESHPDDLDFKKLKALKGEGVDWLSIGVQSFDNKLLKKNARIQNNKRISKVVSSARRAGIKNIQIDLIAGLPFQSEDVFLKDIDAAKKLSPERIYLFPFQSKRLVKLKGKDHPWLWKAYRRAVNKLSDSGYEISCGRWVYKKTGGDWPYSYDQGERISKNFYSVLGLGPSAISYARGKARYQNFSAYKKYAESIDKNLLPIEKGFQLSLEDEMRNFLILNLIQRGVLEKSEFASVFKKDIGGIFAQGLLNLRRRGILSFSKGKYYLNDRENGLFNIRKEFYETGLLEKMKAKYFGAIEGEYKKLEKECRPKEKSADDKKDFINADFGIETFAFGINNKAGMDAAGLFHDVLEKIYIERKRNNKKHIIFLNWGLLSRGNLSALVEFAKKLGYKQISLLADGKDLDKKSLKQLMKNGLNGVELFIHSSVEKINDEIAGIKGAYKKNLKILKDVLSMGFHVRVNSMVSKPNYRGIFKTFKALNENFGINNFRYVFAKSAGMDKKDLTKRLPDWKSAARRLEDIYELKAGNVNVSVVNLPPCLAPLAAGRIGGALKEDFKTEPGVYKEEGFIKPSKCVDCALQLNCPGADAGYISLFGDADIKPIRREKKRK